MFGNVPCTWCNILPGGHGWRSHMFVSIQHVHVENMPMDMMKLARILELYATNELFLRLKIKEQ